MRVIVVVEDEALLGFGLAGLAMDTDFFLAFEGFDGGGGLCWGRAFEDGHGAGGDCDCSSSSSSYSASSSCTSCSVLKVDDFDNRGCSSCFTNDFVRCLCCEAGGGGDLLDTTPFDKAPLLDVMRKASVWKAFSFRFFVAIGLDGSVLGLLFALEFGWVLLAELAGCIPYVNRDNSASIVPSGAV